MQVGFIFLMTVWAAGTAAFVVVLRSVKSNPIFQLNLESVPDKAPEWAKQSWPVLLALVPILMICIAPALIALPISEALQRSLWSCSGDIFLNPHVVWAVFPGLFLGMVLGFLLLDLLLLPFPTFAICLEVQSEVNNQLQSKTAAERKIERERLFEKAWRQHAMKDRLFNHWIMLLAGLIAWIVFVPPSIFILDDYVRVNQKGIGVNSIFDLSEKLVPWSDIKEASAGYENEEAKFFIRTTNGDKIDIWGTRGWSLQRDDDLLNLAKQIVSRKIPLKVDYDTQSTQNDKQAATILGALKKVANAE